MVTSNNLAQNTTHKVVLPFYVYAALSFFVATILLFISGDAFTQHHFHPRTLAITHTMALGWGTMIILGASHQLVPVLTGSKLYSNGLAYASFLLASVGIPLLVWCFFNFRMDRVAQAGSILINAAIICFVINLVMGISKSRKGNVHAVFVLTASLWLLATTIIGLLLVFNFTVNILPGDSLRYLSLHAHIGIVGWFLLLVMGVGSRLIPMFLISKYDHPKTLWGIYGLVNGALGIFIVMFIYGFASSWYIIPLAASFLALVLFARFCWKAYQERIRKQVDGQVKISLLSVAMMMLPIVFLVVLILLLVFSFANEKLVLAYGFSIFFGWLTAIILGMTFKTLPFIVWNKVYHNKAAATKVPNPKDLFSQNVFNAMGIFYLAGFCLFLAGVLLAIVIMVQAASLLLILTAVLFNFNILKMLRHKLIQ
ncbi:MAG: cytochrome C oxidase subunit I [Flavisolibacter sp.]